MGNQEVPRLPLGTKIQNARRQLEMVKDNSGKLMHWFLRLQGFDFELKHVPGKDNVVADALWQCHWCNWVKVTRTRHTDMHNKLDQMGNRRGLTRGVLSTDLRMYAYYDGRLSGQSTRVRAGSNLCAEINQGKLI